MLLLTAVRCARQKQDAAAGGIRRGRFSRLRTRSEGLEAGNDTVIDNPESADGHSSHKSDAHPPPSAACFNPGRQ